MDILLPLLFVAIAYVAPKLVEKLWKDYQLKIGNYVNLQENGFASKKKTNFADGQMSTYTPSTIEYQIEAELEPVPVMAHSTLSPAVSSPPPSETKVWSGKMDANAVINGVIFAEIVQPPRAYRPFVRRK